VHVHIQLLYYKYSKQHPQRRPSLKIRRMRTYGQKQMTFAELAKE
jgi:hypothetical protein